MIPQSPDFLSYTGQVFEYLTNGPKIQAISLTWCWSAPSDSREDGRDYGEF
jgi:hypothetical protein